MNKKELEWYIWWGIIDDLLNEAGENLSEAEKSLFLDVCTQKLKEKLKAWVTDIDEKLFLEEIIKETKFQNKANNAVINDTKTQVSDVVEGKKEKIKEEDVNSRESLIEYMINYKDTPQKSYDYFMGLKGKSSNKNKITIRKFRVNDMWVIRLKSLSKMALFEKSV